MTAEPLANRPPRRLAGTLWAAFCAAVFPARCLHCRRLLPAGSGAVDSDAAEDFANLLRPYFCPDCRSGVLPLEHPFCPCCGIMFRGRSGEDHLCSRCLEQAPPFHMARAAFAYDRALVDVIHCFKYKEKIGLAGPLGILLWQTFCQYWGDEPVDLIVPVPLHGRRLRQRGFNQSDLLVHGWKKRARRRDLPPIVSGVLRRTRTTRPQAGLSRRERESNIRAAFSVRQPDRVRGRHVLLIDDVITTGATVGECARQLLASGAGRVDVLALARVI
jgi:ComF family protein